MLARLEHFLRGLKYFSENLRGLKKKLRGLNIFGTQEFKGCENLFFFKNMMCEKNAPSRNLEEKMTDPLDLKINKFRRFALIPLLGTDLLWSILRTYRYCFVVLMIR